MPVGNFNLPLQGDYWEPPSDWIDISSVGNNEINILVDDSYFIKFTVTMALGGTYTIDWGDGVIETLRNSGTAYVHTYAFGGGTPCSLGYTTYKIRIYNATNPITQFQFQSPVVGDISPLKTQFNVYGTLWMVFGTNDLTSLNSMTSNASSNYLNEKIQAIYLPPDISKITNWARAFQACQNLKIVKGLTSPWSTSCTTTALMFAGCTSINSISLPATLPNSITTFQNMFASCTALLQIKIPNWPTGLTGANALQSVFSNCISLRNVDMPSALPNGATNVSSMFSNCQNLRSMTITSWPNALTSAAGMFFNNYNLNELTLPSGGFPATCTDINNFANGCSTITKVNLGTSWGGITNITSIFQVCGNLTEVVFPTTLGVITTAQNVFTNSRNIRSLTNGYSIGTSNVGAGCSFNQFMGTGNFNPVTGFTTNSYISKFTFNGDANNQLNLQSLRLTQAGSTYTGTSPHINISFTQLGQAALVQVFNDLPTLTSKTINITSAAGAASLTAGERAIATGKGWTIIG